MNDKGELSDLGQSNISFDELRMKQSVRTTFRLPKEIINLLGLIASQLGIKQKSLLDQLIEDASMLHELGKEVKQAANDLEDRQAKTFVISRSTLQSINRMAKKEKVPRDILVEISIKRLLPIIETELEKHLKRKKIIKEMKGLMKIGQTLLTQTKEVVGENDPLYDMIDSQVQLAQKNINRAEMIITRGMPMEEW